MFIIFKYIVFFDIFPCQINVITKQISPVRKNKTALNIGERPSLYYSAAQEYFTSWTMLLFCIFTNFLGNCLCTQRWSGPTFVCSCKISHLFHFIRTKLEEVKLFFGIPYYYQINVTSQQISPKIFFETYNFFARQFLRKRKFDFQALNKGERPSLFFIL